MSKLSYEWVNALSWDLQTCRIFYRNQTIVIKVALQFMMIVKDFINAIHNNNNSSL